LEEAEQNLLSAFEKSSKTKHPGSKGDARAKNVADFLQKRLPSGYGVLCHGEIVDYLDARSGEIDILIFDRVRNSVLSEDPLWAPAESLLAYIEVKSRLSREELTSSYLAAKRINSLKPFKRPFTLAASDSKTDAADSLRCFRTLFAYGTDLTEEDWLNKEWGRVIQASTAAECEPGSIDRILVLNRGMINPPSGTGTDQFQVSSVFQQWYINLTNFLARENARRPPVDWELYSKTRIPGWRRLSS
jgi:hypothetical protein